MKPVLLDLFCGAGGAARGYQQAGFHVVGVDIKPQPEYAGDEFIQSEAVGYALVHGHKYDAIHASPPCQYSSALTKGTNRGKKDYPDLIPKTRYAINLHGVPTVIENVNGAMLRRDITLCGEMFGLGVIRHRHFEVTEAAVPAPDHLPHRGKVAGMRHGVWQTGPYYAVYGRGGGKGSMAQWRQAMGIDWITNRVALAEAVPPAYTKYVGDHLMNYYAYA